MDCQLGIVVKISGIIGLTSFCFFIGLQTGSKKKALGDATYIHEGFQLAGRVT